MTNRKLLLFLIVLSVFLSACVEKPSSDNKADTGQTVTEQENTVKQNHMAITDNETNADRREIVSVDYYKELDQFYGTWYVKKMLYKQRDKNEEHVKKMCIGKKLVISSDAITLDDEPYQIVKMFEQTYEWYMGCNYAYGDAARICGAEFSEDGEITPRGSMATEFYIRGEEKVFGLTITGDGDLLIDFGEDFNSGAYYELSKEKPNE